ncbi:MAG: transporter substrate-binding domain-containing protein [Rhodospirillales bacterium]|nr:transporter substrate-binding domain-containing protein [Rhodospirillales bacterium]
MKPFSVVLLTVIVAVVASFLTVQVTVPKNAGGGTVVSKQKESVYERVMRTGKIRCGYAVWQPVLMKDPNTGAFSGVYYDYMNLLAARLGMEVEWTLELSLATYLEDMAAGKYDVECSGGWPNAQRGKVAEYTTPLYFNPIYLYAREGDTRFDEDRSLINTPDVRFGTMVGEQSETYRAEAYPNSKEVSLPGSVPLSELLMQLVYGKVDVAFYDEMSAKEFMQKQPGKIRRIPGPPVKVIPNNLSVAKGEQELVNMLNTATQELIYEGAIERILQKYGVTEDVALRPALPYRQD